MIYKELTNGQTGLYEISDFIENNYNDEYTLLIFDMLSENTLKIICTNKEIALCVGKISSIEHDFPSWICKNDEIEAYIVGMNFVKGRLDFDTVYKFENDKLI